jgi:hypothetical protein
MTEQTQPASGTVAEEAAWLIEALASMARLSAAPSPDPGPDPGRYADGTDAKRYAGGRAREPGPSGAPEASQAPDPRDCASGVTCSTCGEGDGTPSACRLCPLCQGIALLRSVRPETVDRIADFASAVAASLRDVATQARASGRASGATPASGKPSERGRPTVQDIPVDDEDER